MARLVSQVQKPIWLEDVLQTKLDLTLIACRAADLAKSGRGGTLLTEGRAGIGKVDVVEGIEELRSELQTAALTDSDVFEEAKIPGLKSRSVERVAAQIAIGVGGRHLERRRVEPPGRCPLETGRLRIWMTFGLWCCVRCPSF